MASPPETLAGFCLWLADLAFLAIVGVPFSLAIFLLLIELTHRRNDTWFIALAPLLMCAGPWIFWANGRCIMFVGVTIGGLQLGPILPPTCDAATAVLGTRENFAC